MVVKNCIETESDSSESEHDDCDINNDTYRLVKYRRKKPIGLLDNYLSTSPCKLPRFSLNNVEFTNDDKKSKRNDIRCGGIILDPTFKFTIIILNRLSMLGGNPKWGLPKGHLSSNETYAQCAIREIEEETGLVLHLNESSSRVKINNTYYFPLILPMNVKLNPKDKTEICDIKWIDIELIGDLNTNRELKKFLTIVSKVIKLSKLNKLINNVSPKLHSMNHCKDSSKMNSINYLNNDVSSQVHAIKSGSSY